ncbi:ubiquinone biosynthesis protein, partial [Brevibacterium aurantiacum]
MSAVVAVTVQYLYRAGTGHNVDGLDISPGVAVLFTVLALGWIFALGVAALVMLEAAFP